MADFKRAFEAARLRLPYKTVRETNFTSLEAARNFLTPKRLQILRLIKKQNPKSIYQLAKFCRRSFPSVLGDVELLARHGLLQLDRSKVSRRSIHPNVAYDRIVLTISI